MLEALIIAFLITWGIRAILGKYKFYDKFTLWAGGKTVEEDPRRFWYKLSQCQFCMDHHTAIIPSFIAVYLTFHGSMDYWLFLKTLAMPFMVSALTNLTNYLRR